MVKRVALAISWLIGIQQWNCTINRILLSGFALLQATWYNILRLFTCGSTYCAFVVVVLSGWTASISKQTGATVSDSAWALFSICDIDLSTVWVSAISSTGVPSLARTSTSSDTREFSSDASWSTESLFISALTVSDDVGAIVGLARWHCQNWGDFLDRRTMIATTQRVFQPQHDIMGRVSTLSNVVSGL